MKFITVTVTRDVADPSSYSCSYLTEKLEVVVERIVTLQDWCGVRCIIDLGTKQIQVDETLGQVKKLLEDA